MESRDHRDHRGSARRPSGRAHPAYTKDPIYRAGGELRAGGFRAQVRQQIYFGDASRLDLLHAAGADKAKIFVLAIDDVEASLKTAQMVKTHYPHLKIYARSRNACTATSCWISA